MNEPMIILFGDDDADDRNLFCGALREVDPAIICQTAIDGYAVLKYLRNKSNPLPRYIFLDLRMPKMSGKQCLLEIRSDDRLRDIPVIIYTTSNDEADSLDLVESGATHFVTKPTNPEEIYYLLSMVITENWV